MTALLAMVIHRFALAVRNQIKPPCACSARDSRFSLPSAAKDHQRQRLFLAHAQLRPVPHSGLRACVLAAKTRAECGAGQVVAEGTAASGLAGAHGLGMPDDQGEAGDDAGACLAVFKRVVNARWW